MLAKNGNFTWFEGKYGSDFRKHIGAILETPNFYPHLDADKNLEIVAQIKDIKVEDFTEVLELVNLKERRKSPFRTYSLGMKQRLAIAATIISEPEVLIFDEPTNGLDPQGIAEVRSILQRVASSGKTVIMASHILDEVEKICSHVAIIKKGHLLASGPIGTILSNDQLLELNGPDLEKIQEFIASTPFIKFSLNGKTFLECTIPESVTATEINQLAFDQGIILNHLVVRKRRLEEEFLEITENA